MRKLLFVFGIACVAASIWMWRQKNKPVEIYYPQVTQVSVTETGVPTKSPEPVQTEMLLPTATVLPQLQPTKTTVPSVQGNRLAGGVIDLANGQSIALAIILPDGGELRSSWAFSYFEGADWRGGYPPESPYSGALYSSYANGGQMVVVRPHSGIVTTMDLFGQVINRYLKASTLEEGKKKLEALRDAPGYLCQADELKEKFSKFEGECPGRKVAIQVQATALILQPDTDKYDETLTTEGNPVAWLVDHGYDFSFVSAGSGLLLSTCVDRYPDQTPVSGVHVYSFNRAGFWIKVLQ